MNLTSVAVEVDPSSHGMARMKLAVDFAARHRARLIGVGADDFDLAWGGGVGGGATAEMKYRDADAALAALEQHFLAAAAELPKKEFRSAYGTMRNFLSQTARAADLVIAGRREGAVEGHRFSGEPGALALQLGRPLLFVPPGVERLGEDIVVVAWKDCRESRRAVNDALALLRLAKSVHVVGVGDETDESVLADVESFLQGHSVKAKKEWHPCRGAGAGETLLSVSADLKADLLVAGAYGHSRFQEWVLGGVTQALVERSPIPCLLSH